MTTLPHSAPEPRPRFECCDCGGSAPNPEPGEPAICGRCIEYHLETQHVRSCQA